MKNLIIEGCDGSGKDTLIYSLRGKLPLAKHTRASTSIGGPVPDLDLWVEMDLDYIENRNKTTKAYVPFIYNRHPLVSEIIYSDIRENRRGLSGKFQDIGWLLESQRRMAAVSTLIICSPPYEEVERVMQEQGREAHMPGVFENRHTLWRRYTQFVWPGTVIRYDRTRETVTGLVRILNKMGD